MSPEPLHLLNMARLSLASTARVVYELGPRHS